ncbi:hypothetical protein HYU91_00755 [Candidatus Collierbacteria bacterium]|nr:hypothetical protein [Candidatus Collierbacteria bacterium]
MAGIEELRTKFTKIEKDLLAEEKQNFQDLLIQVLLDECSEKKLKISIIPEAGGYRLELGSFPPKLYSDVYDLVAAAWNLLKITTAAQDFVNSDTPNIGFELIGPNRM